jgi:peptidoglycan/LPS O-acetylase OafA/YrhL
MRTPNGPYIPEVDCLRAFAALLVVAYHGTQIFSSRFAYGRGFNPNDWIFTENPVLSLVLEGHTGVALFMVLSGFILTVVSGAKPVSYTGFLRNRALRIYPLLLFLLVFGAAANPAGFNLSAFAQTVLPIQDMPGSLAAGPFGAMFWTIGIEFQFYLVFPFLLLIAQRNPTRTLLAWVALVVCFRGFAALSAPSIRDLAYWHLAGRLDQFLLGMLVGFHFQRLRQRCPFPGEQACAALLVLAVIYAFHRCGGWPAESPLKVFWPTIEGCAWAALVAAMCTRARSSIPLARRLLAQVGVWSYSIYLVHFVVISAMVKLKLVLRPTGDTLIDAWLTTALLLLPAVVSLSWFTYNFVERPFLELRRSYHSNKSSLSLANPQSAAA